MTRLIPLLSLLALLLIAPALTVAQDDTGWPVVVSFQPPTRRHQTARGIFSGANFRSGYMETLRSRIS
jgi:hypothetical protein